MEHDNENPSNEALVKLANNLVLAQEGRHLNDLEKIILEQTLEGRSYKQMEAPAEAGTLKNIGSNLWKILTEALGEKVTKTTVGAKLTLYIRSQNNSEPSPVNDTSFEAESQNLSSSETIGFQKEKLSLEDSVWEDFIEQVLEFLSNTLPHSTLFRSITRSLGFDSRAYIKSSDRHDFLQRVQKIWLDGYLVNALSNYGLMQLSLENRYSALLQYQNISWENPQHFKQSTQKTFETPLFDTFNTIRPLRRLLILGAPGSGKTITLLGLLKDLCDQAEKDDSKPIPVVLSLSTYAVSHKDMDFVRWLVMQLERQYSVSPQKGNQFVISQKLLLLLDGLDEIAPSAINKCIRNINEFLRVYERTECVICSRQRDYAVASEKLQLDAALSLEPLSLVQAISYLKNLPHAQSLRGLIRAIEANDGFQEIATTPLVLNVMAVAYANLPSSEIKCFTSIEAHYYYLYERLFERLLNRKQPTGLNVDPGATENNHPYSKQETRKWLIWLAKKMVNRSQKIFYIEHLRPRWLDTYHQRQSYYYISTILISLVIGIISACHMTPISGWHVTGEVTTFFLPLLLVSICGSTLAGLIFINLYRLFPRIVSGFIAASIYVIFWGLIAKPYVNATDISSYIGTVSPIAIDWLGMALFWGLPRDDDSEHEDFVVIHRLHWSWLSAFRFVGISGVAYGLFYLPVRMFLLGQYAGNYNAELLYEPLLISGFTAIYGGLALGMPPLSKDITTPNQSVHKALSNVVLLASVIGCVGMLVAWQYAHGNPYEYAMLAAALGLLAALYGGRRSGQVLIEHIVMRIILWWNHSAPWNYARFLDFATRRLLLKQVGGGYSFMHRSFQEYLTTLDE